MAFHFIFKPCVPPHNMSARPIQIRKHRGIVDSARMRFEVGVPTSTFLDELLAAYSNCDVDSDSDSGSGESAAEPTRGRVPSPAAASRARQAP